MLALRGANHQTRGVVMNKLTLIALVVASFRLMACGGTDLGQPADQMGTVEQNLDLEEHQQKQH